MGKYLPIILAARHGSLNKAASLCGYAQPSMMYIINKLEDDLGVKLFYRSKRGVTLTEAGKKLLEVMEEIEAQEERLRSMAQSFRETRLRIGTFPDLPGRWISGLLAAIRKDSPEAMVRLETTVSHRQGLEDVKNGALSCCFSITRRLSFGREAWMKTSNLFGWSLRTKKPERPAITQDDSSAREARIWLS